jgi:hypothetical protein
MQLYNSMVLNRLRKSCEIFCLHTFIWCISRCTAFLFPLEGMIAERPEGINSHTRHNTRIQIHSVFDYQCCGLRIRIDLKCWIRILFWIRWVDEQNWEKIKAEKNYFLFEKNCNFLILSDCLTDSNLTSQPFFVFHSLKGNYRTGGDSF